MENDNEEDIKRIFCSAVDDGKGSIIVTKFKTAEEEQIDDGAENEAEVESDEAVEGEDADVHGDPTKDIPGGGVQMKSKCSAATWPVVMTRGWDLWAPVGITRLFNSIVGEVLSLDLRQTSFVIFLHVDLVGSFRHS